MKKINLGPRARTILLAIGCLLLAIIFWFVVKYSQTDSLPIISFGLS